MWPPLRCGRAAADAFAKAEEIEAAMVLKFVGRPRNAKYVQEWAEKNYRDNEHNVTSGSQLRESSAQ